MRKLLIKEIQKAYSDVWELGDEAMDILMDRGTYLKWMHNDMSEDYLNSASEDYLRQLLDDLDEVAEVAACDW